MRTLDEWFAEYSVSHQNMTNKKIHYICVPAIFFSVVGLLMSIPNRGLISLVHSDNFLLVNWAVAALILVLYFYLRLCLRMALYILIFSALCVIGNFYLAKIGPLWITSLIIFSVAWIGQFYGHKLEGKKPSFFKDIQFLLIGPAWILTSFLSPKKT
ncbi:DUF962 domain-containing protein [Fluviicola taffensis]|uniref:PRS2 protein n=1 Tax=Fluviicola taffensis (strain DSM 16823 / NCIMB 13979 / RW262) TaxID=755732 RepID=F2ICC2_FLUTR|nr:Mpo1-like protein [Fluviicola taffensis]AEA44368.1 hypothetical protein Fluta_2382 [Fluviicola taffensis DSM 16823]